jgi:[ribosomal protein S5]-alanine N-acetyltransferase
LIYNEILKGDTIFLRVVDLNDCNQTYLNWLNDVDVNKFLETRWNKQSLESIKSFVEEMRKSEHSYLFAINIDDKHIGNIKIGPIHAIYKYADVSYFIGDKSQWGKGIATEAIKLITDFGFTILGLNRLQAGAYEYNIGSQRALEKNGYKKEAVYRKKSFIHLGDEYCNSYMYGILKDEWT